ncbi:MAG: LuxR C-terminal-related transcriptional regulator [Burkholderiales bacterium]
MPRAPVSILGRNAARQRRIAREIMARAISVHLVAGDEATLVDWGRTLGASGYRVASFGSSTEFLACGLPARPDCVITEATLPDASGLDLQQRVVERDPSVSIVFASQESDFRTIVRAMRAGAIDFLETPVARGALLDAVARAVERTAGLRAAESRRCDHAQRFARLTPRERAILTQVLEGRLNKQIAAALDCKEATVKVHRSRLMRKLGVSSLARLVQLAQEAGVGRRETATLIPAMASAAPRDPVDQAMPLDRVIEVGLRARTGPQGIPQPAI